MANKSPFGLIGLIHPDRFPVQAYAADELARRPYDVSMFSFQLVFSSHESFFREREADWLLNSPMIEAILME